MVLRIIGERERGDDKRQRRRLSEWRQLNPDFASGVKSSFDGRAPRAYIFPINCTKSNNMEKKV